MIRASILLAAAALGVSAFLVEPSVIVDGGRTLEGWWLSVGAIALVILGLTWRTAWQDAGRLAAAFAVGSAAQLALTKAKWLQYVKFRTWELTEGTAPIAIVMLLLQAAVVGMSLRRHAPAIGDLAARALRPGRALVLGVVFILCAAHFTLVWPHLPDARRLATFGIQLFLVGGFALLSLANLAALMDAAPAEALARLQARLSAAFSTPGAERATRGDRLLPWGLAALAFTISATLCLLVLDRVPHVPDGVAYLFQAECLARGHAVLDAPPVPEAFRVYLIEIHEGSWYGTTHLGWPATLAAGSLFGVPWLVNPVLAALAVLATHALARRLADRGTAHVITLLLAVSPWFLWLGASFMTHVATYLAAVTGWWLVAKARDDDAPWAALLGGLAMGWLFTIRPLDGLVLGALTGLWALRGGKTGLAVFYAVGCVAGGAPLLVFNAAVAGGITRFPINAYTDRLWYHGANRFGFGADVGNPPDAWGPLDPFRGHGWRDVILNTNQNLYNLNFELFGWSTGSLLPIVGHALARGWSRVDKAWLLLAGVLLVLYNGYWFSGGPDYGARYWFLVLFPCLWWAARGLIGWSRAVPRGQITLAVGVLVVVSMTVFMPWRATAKYVDYRGFNADYRRLVADEDLTNTIVFVSAPNDVEYACAFLQNTIGLEGDGPIFVRDLGEETNARTRAAWPNRRAVYR